MATALQSDKHKVQLTNGTRCKDDVKDYSYKLLCGCFSRLPSFLHALVFVQKTFLWLLTYNIHTLQVKLASLHMHAARGLGGGGEWGEQGKLSPSYRLCEVGSGGTPQKILRFYMLWSVFWELPRLLFMHACIKDIHTCKLSPSFSSFRKVRCMGP